MVEARYYQKLAENKVKCSLCPNYCVISENRYGRCLGRKNIGGQLFAVNYGEVVSYAIDPMEKKPLYHFYPGREIFSVATYGCNLLCPFCQNWEISQNRVSAVYLEPEELINIVLREQCEFIAYTYTEPLIWFEYLLDVMKLAKKKNIKNVLVTNGMINEEPLKELLPYVSAMNIDLKSIKEEFYKDFIKGSLKTVLRTIEVSKDFCHIEITNLLIPQKNDSDEEIKELVNFLFSLKRSIPLHFSRYFPHYKLSLPATPVETLLKAYYIAREKLYYVYLGNVFGLDVGQDTFCPDCNNLLIRRNYYNVKIVGLDGKNCSKCKREIEIIL